MARLVERDGEAAQAEAQLIATEARVGLGEVGAALRGRAGGGLARETTASVEALTAAGIAVDVRGDMTTVFGILELNSAAL